MTRPALLLVPAFALLAACGSDTAPAPAASETATGTGTGMASASAAPMNEAQTAYKAVNDAMHSAMMDVPADADRAYMQGMLAHHRGAIGMSEAVLKYGKDAGTKDLARRVIAAQTREIAEIESWLKANGGAMAESATTAEDHSAHM